MPVAFAAVLTAVVATVVVLGGGAVEEPTPTAVPDPQGGPMPAITVVGNEIHRAGRPWWLLGYNSFTWSGDCGHPEELMTSEQIEDWFAGMRHDGHGGVRLFFFPGWNIERLDAAIAAARRHNIYITLTLDNGNEDCGVEEKTPEWFADDSERAVFADHMTMLLERYRGDTTIAWFEYFNEPRYADGALRQFYDEMGALADTVDPDRLFSSGAVAPYFLGGEDNFRDVHESSGVDIASLHEYDFTESESHHGPPALANAAGKPVIVGEFGVIDFLSDDCSSDVEERVARARAKTTAYLTTPGYIGAFAWAWQPGASADCNASLDSDPAVQSVFRDGTP